MYLIYLIIVVMAFGINIYLSTRTPKADGGESGIAPVVQMVITLPILLISAGVFFFLQNTSLGINHRSLFVFLPFILEVSYFAYTKDLFRFFKSDGALIRSYIYAIGLATIVGYVFSFIF